MQHIVESTISFILGSKDLSNIALSKNKPTLVRGSNSFIGSIMDVKCIKCTKSKCFIARQVQCLYKIGQIAETNFAVGKVETSKRSCLKQGQYYKTIFVVIELAKNYSKILMYYFRHLMALHLLNCNIKMKVS